jgi:hypothetical protein
VAAVGVLIVVVGVEEVKKDMLRFFDAAVKLFDIQ